ncbi:ABC-2 transporter permease [Paenibacillus aquistagni]|uniref:ABC-2 transporter permease n=1 Tax=Paenibacillus aquistagni TaxID=1852522 RepID=UPI00145B68F2|nr:ABC-2 transporter permease [Paenibacillus aquistagni]NMM53038.1 hypothetical protein [Paenibacillus aquistagni]
MWRNFFNTGLWSKEFRQVRFMLYAILGLGFITLPLVRMNRWWFAEQRHISNSVENIIMNPDYEPWLYDIMNLQILMLVMGTILAIWQIGSERRANMQEFTLSLPYSRVHIYTVKWLLGVAFLLGSFFLSTAVDASVICTSELAPFVEWGGYASALLRALLINLALYTFVLAVGTMCGSVISQLSFLGILILMPEFIRLMFDRFCWAFDIPTLKKETTIEGMVYYTSKAPKVPTPDRWLFYDAGSEEINAWFWGATIAIIVVCYALGLFLYVRNKAENNGKLVIFPSLETILRGGFTICFALLGASIATSLFTNGPVPYSLGFLAALVIGYLMIRKLTKLKLKI